MILEIECVNDISYRVEEHEREGVIELLEVLNDPEEMFVQFEVYGKAVVLSKLQIISLEIT